MCGICGFIGLEDRALLRSMNDALQHRGPDDSGYFVDKAVGLGHRRLSIIDLNTGHQPLSNEDGTIWVVFNGEIYNYKELRAELSARHRFATSSDTEVIVHLYEDDPDGFVERLDGMFALAIYDLERGRLTLARDPFGKKPLYYCQEQRGFFFASEIKALLAAGIAKEVDLDMVACFLGYQYTRGTSTMFRSVRKLPPSHMMVVEGGKVELRKYWDVHGGTVAITEVKATEQVLSHLQASVRKRMIADVPIGAYLSGGIDSSAVVALSRPLADYTFHTFALGFPTVSELPFARMVAEHVGTEHHEIMVDEGMVLSAIEKVSYHHDEPVGDAAILNNYFLSREACKWVKVVLAGEGGDELFAGYDNYSRCLQMHRLRSRRAVGGLAYHFARLFPGRGDLRRGRMEKELSMLEEGDLDRRLSISTRELSPRELKWLTGTPGPDLEGMGWPPQGISGDLDRLLYNDLRNRMAEGYLMKADKANMANSVEERLPLLDKSLAELAFSLPAELKLKGRTEKHILRLALHGRLPDTILARKKMGFSTPVSDWMRGEVGEAAVERMTANPLVRSITDPANLGKWVVQAEKKGLRRPRAFWNLYALAVWHDTFF